LEYYGYVKGTGSKNLNDALKSFQTQWGLESDGILGPITQGFISRPRSANSDIKDDTKPVLLTKLRKSHYKFTYTVSDIDDDLVDINAADLGLAKLLAVINASITAWTKPLGEKLGHNITFEYVEPDHRNIDLEIKWEPFDGIGGTLGYANGKSGIAKCSIELDKEERWTYDPKSPYCLQPVLTHELGHLFGLHHENKEDTIMNPYYRATFLAPTERDLEAVAKRAADKIVPKEKKKVDS